MLPPVDESVLKDNPDFEKLYKSLSTDVLNPDGSTKKDAGAKQRDAVREELKEYRLRATRQHLLKQAIATATPQSASASASSSQAAGAGKQIPLQQRRTRSHFSRVPSVSGGPSVSEEAEAGSSSQQQLPPELLDLLLLLPDFLEKAPRQLLPQSSLRLLLSTSPFSDFPALLPALASLLSSHLTAQAVSLTRVLHPTTNASFLHRHTATLPAATSSLLAKLAAARRTLTEARLRTTTATFLGYLDQHARALSVLVRALEAKHGPAAHSTALRSQRACLEAALWAAALRLLLAETRARVYPAGAGAALRNYRRHLRDAQMRLEDATLVRERELEDYGVRLHKEGGGDGGVNDNDDDDEDDDDDENQMSAKERRMREMARIWREMEGRLVEIQADLDRLGRS